MYVFEFTDKEIIIYHQKKKILIKEIIPENIIVNNQIYDYLNLVRVLNYIVNKYKIINTIFRIKIKILLFEKKSPSEIYLIRKAFQEIGNFNIREINPTRYFDNDALFISGKNVYYKGNKIKKLPKGKYILIGNSDNYDEIKKHLINKYHIDLYEYENSNTIIYEKV